ncbi:MAG: hypothetical protein K6E52_11450 [Bacteroidaceae bacterium]|nr:hypothetical protein [Bacteroidaceae bacterium]
MKRFFIIAIVLLMTLSSAAQTTKEVYVGYSSVMDYVKVSAFGRTSEETGYGKGLEVGLNYIRPITKPLAVTYGIQAMYGWDKGTISNSNVSGKDQFIKFLVPVSLLCELRPSSSRFAFEPFVGINGSFYALGKTKIGGTTYDWFDGKDSFELNRLLFGWHVGANFVYDRFVLGFNYQEDFLDYADSSPFLQADARWANIEFRFGYRF